MITAQQTILLDAITAFLHGERFCAPDDTDWEEVFAESVAQAVGLIAWQGLDPSNVSEQARGKWQLHALHSLRHNLAVHAQHGALHAVLSAENILYVILKGSAAADYYPDQAMRAMGDVDFLVPKSEVERAGKVLESEGFVQMEDKHLCHYAYAKGKERVELHFAPAGMPSGRMGELMEDYLSDIYAHSRTVTVCGAELVCPSDFHHGLVLLMHTYHHLLSEGIGLRHLTDWAVFVARLDGQFPVLFEKRLRAVGLWRFAQILSQVCARFFNVSYAEWMGTREEQLCDAVMQDVLAGGNFGVKDAGREAQGVVISDRGRSGVKRGRLSQAIRTVNEAGRVRFPRMAKIPLLKHLCFIPMGVRHAILVLTGKRRRVKLSTEWKRAEARKQIYRQFQLFEIGE